MSRLLLILLSGLALASFRASADPGTNDQTSVIVVVGAAGEDEYGKDFAEAAAQWKTACETGGAKLLTIGLGETNGLTDLDRLKQELAAEPKESLNELWLVLLGHGTFDGKEAKFNLRGPDFSATELAAWLKPFKRRLALIDCSSSSAPFMSKIAGPDRVIITATRSGNELYYARFGKFMSEAVSDPQADLDKDGQVSLLEAFLIASRRTGEFYETATRLATEHALLDDNGDGQGTPADWFRGVRAVKKAQGGASVDGLRANQFHLIRSSEEQKLSPEVRARRDELELAIAKLRDQKTKLKEDDYYQQLEPLLVEISKLSAQPAAAVVPVP